MSYDQWKTASPYDDEPDIVEECERVANSCERFIQVHRELSDLTREEEILIHECLDTLKAAAEFIENEI